MFDCHDPQRLGNGELSFGLRKFVTGIKNMPDGDYQTNSPNPRIPEQHPQSPYCAFDLWEILE
jgi:hypothetical protein